MASTTVAYKCPNCQAPLKFAPGQEKITCEFCGSSFDIEKLTEMFAAKEEKAAAAQAVKEEQAEAKIRNKDWDPSSLAAEFAAEEAKLLRQFTCSACGAEIVCDENTMATQCCYCGNPTMVPARFANMLRPDFVIPFQKTKEEAVAALKDFYKGKLLLPSSFKSENRVQSIQAMYVPFWLFDADVYAEGQFEAETESVVSVTNESTTYKYDVYDCYRSGVMRFKRIPVDGSKKMDDEYMDSIEPFDYADLKPFTPAYLAGCLADKYDVNVQEAFPRADLRIKNTAVSMLKSTVDRDSVAETSSNVVRSGGQIGYAMMPVWILSTQYRGKPYSFMMNGQTGKVIGKLPVDIKKKVLSFLLPLLIAWPLIYHILLFLNTLESQTSHSKNTVETVKSIGSWYG